MIIQVDRVAAVDEAIAFRDAGANLIGVAVDSNPSCDDDRIVSPHVAIAIRDAIAPAKLAELVPFHWNGDLGQDRRRLERVFALEPGYIQLYHGSPREEMRPLVQAAGIPVIRTGADIAEDHGFFLPLDDPAKFMRDQLWDHTMLNPTLFQVEILTNVGDPWTFLTQTAPECPDDAPQIADLKGIARTLPVLFSLFDIGPDTVCPHTKAFREARGFYATLGRAGTKALATIMPEPLLAALHTLKHNGIQPP